MIGSVARTSRVALSTLLFGGATLALVPSGCLTANDLATDPTYLSEADAIALCALAARCTATIPEALGASTGIGVSDANFSVCMTWLAGPIAANREGLDLQRSVLTKLVPHARDADCLGAAGALPIRPLTVDDKPCPVSEACPTASLWIDCAGKRVVDCSSSLFPAGTRCYTVGAVSGCAIGACTKNDHRSECSDGAALACSADNGPHAALVCAALGSSCSEGAVDSGSASCAGDAASDRPGASHCSPDRSHVDVSAGVLDSTFDCSALGGACATKKPGEAVCAGAHDACSPWDGDVNTCADDKHLVVCVAGVKKTVDCGSFQCAAAQGAPSACR